MTHFEKLLFCSGDNLVTVELVYMQYNISDSQVLFCFVLILTVASLDTLFLCQNQGFCTYKKECTLLFLQFYQSFSISYIEIFTHLYTLLWTKSLFINFDTFKKYCLVQNGFSTLPSKEHATIKTPKVTQGRRLVFEY